jgi:hypothetical protein
MRSSHFVLGDLRIHTLGAIQSLRAVCVQPALGPVAGIVGPSVGEFEAVVDEERSFELARREADEVMAAHGNLRTRSIVWSIPPNGCCSPPTILTKEQYSPWGSNKKNARGRRVRG